MEREKYILINRCGEIKIYDMTVEEYDLVEDILYSLDVTEYNLINIENCDAYKRDN